MKKSLFYGLMLTWLSLASAGLTSCLNNDDETIILEVPSTGIPDDSKAKPNPAVPTVTTTIPNIQTTLDEINGVLVIRVDMTGVKNNDDVNYVRLYGTDSSEQNVWVEVDGKPKGITVYNNADDSDGQNIKVDVVFTIDNSSSMSEEADAVARDIISWAQQLSASGLDARYGVVGYGGFVDGAINLTTVNELSGFLNESRGTGRTQHFGGTDASKLETLASSFPSTSKNYDRNECGAMGIEFADSYFTFRSGANRIYVNFTDEPNQPNGNSTYSVKYFESQENWPAAKGTVHTVYSDSESYTNNWNYIEQPWLISEYTGGTTLFASPSFANVTLASLPVTGAMENSYIIRFANIDELLDGKEHTIHITIVSKDGTVRADKTFMVVFRK